MSVFRLETAIESQGVPTLRAYQVKFTKARLAMKNGAPFDGITVSDNLQELSLVAVPANVRLTAEINYGRWIGRCECGSGVAVHPAWEWAGCLDCGTVYTEIDFPDAETLRAVVQTLSERPGGIGGRRHLHRSWLPSETVLDLKRENQQYGWSKKP